jgi:prevent-host-death family protein
MDERKVRELGVSDARANMTDVISEARLLDVDFVLTRRDKPQAVLISVKRYEQAKSDRELVAYIRANWPDIYTDMTAALRNHGG